MGGIVMVAAPPPPSLPLCPSLPAPCPSLLACLSTSGDAGAPSSCRASGAAGSRSRLARLHCTRQLSPKQTGLPYSCAPDTVWQAATGKSPHSPPHAPCKPRMCIPPHDTRCVCTTSHTQPHPTPRACTTPPHLFLPLPRQQDARDVHLRLLGHRRSAHSRPPAPGRWGLAHVRQRCRRQPSLHHDPRRPRPRRLPGPLPRGRCR